MKTLGSGITTTGQPYILMEYLDGPVLHALIKDRSPLLDGNRLQLIRQMTEAVGAVHKAGFIHRDICPRNFICSKKATDLKLIDFGLTVPATPEFMQPGNRTGTPSYMAPEVIRRRPTDQRLDLFSLGVTCYQLCAMELPWPGQDVSGMAAMLHDTQEPIDLRKACPWVHPVLAGVIMECLAIHPYQRPQVGRRNPAGHRPTCDRKHCRRRVGQRRAATAGPNAARIGGNCLNARDCTRAAVGPAPTERLTAT